MTQVVAALSGGGAKSAAHVGAMRALAEAGLMPSRFVGTSMGAVIGAAFAASLEPDAILARLVDAGRRGLARSLLAPLGGLYLSSLMRPEPLRRAIEGFLPARRFADLDLPLTVTATDLDTGELKLFGAGGTDVPLVDALMASSALPMFFPAVTIDGRRYGDGGLRGVVPLEPAAVAGAELIVALDIGPGFDELAAAPSPYPSLVRAHNDATGILMAANTALQLALWRTDPSRPRLLYVRPRVERHATFRVDQAEAYAEEGYRATRAALAEL
ncbi:MAG TPA: patatin-like phospholipase family protein [Gemmatimonadales bacterium]|nr:patatin-like phospholipase family protein [Gemmatimonadales bacterium]